MKRIFRFSMLLILFLSACSSSSSDAECKEGICISIEVEGPVQALVPARFIISVKTDKDVSGLGVTFEHYLNVSIYDVVKNPEASNLAYQDENMQSWLIDTKGGEEYTFSGYIVFEKPTVSYGIFSYGLLAAAGHPSIARVTDSVTIYLDAEGKQVEESQVKMELETVSLAPTPPPDLTIIPETPFPTIVWPTVTPPPSPSPSPTITRTPTLPVYP